MNFIERFSKSDGKEIILVLVDRFSKHSHFMALVHPYIAYSVTKVFADNVYKLHGLSATIVSDMDLIFIDQELTYITQQPITLSLMAKQRWSTSA